MIEVGKMQAMIQTAPVQIGAEILIMFLIMSLVLVYCLSGQDNPKWGVSAGVIGQTKYILLMGLLLFGGALVGFALVNASALPKSEIAPWIMTAFALSLSIGFIMFYYRYRRSD